MVGEPVEITIERLGWSPENVAHIARHGVTPDDVERVVEDRPLFFRNLPGRSATHIMIGRDGNGRVLYIPIIQTPHQKNVWLAISAWESRFARKLYPPE